MAYEYDIFLSYNRKFPHGDWVNDIFYPLFKSYIDEALNEDVKIFKDSQEIQSGYDWKLKIRSALIKSKVMVSIFSPSYFRSEWCMREFSTIYQRQKELGFLTLQNPTGLIIPIKIFDGEHFPEYASTLQMLNCIDFNRVGPGVKQTNLYIDLQGKLQTWVYDVAYALGNAPNFDSQWMNEDWVEKAFDKLKTEKLPTIINPPTL
jgi:TIR domain